MTKTLMLMRHAEAVPSHRNGNLARPLVTEGHRQAMTAGQLMRKHKLIPDQIIASPAVRIQETVLAMEDAWGKKIQRVNDVALFDMAHRAQPYSSPDELLGDFKKILRQAQLDAERLLIMGHQPMIGNLVHALGTGLPYDVTVDYPSATLTVLEVPEKSWSSLSLFSCPCQKVIFNGTRLIDASVPSQATPPAPEVK